MTQTAPGGRAWTLPGTWAAPTSIFRGCLHLLPRHAQILTGSTRRQATATCFQITTPRAQHQFPQKWDLSPKNDAVLGKPLSAEPSPCPHLVFIYIYINIY